MSWKKNIFSYLMWAIYLLIIGTAMAFIGSAICGSIGVAEYIGGIAAEIYLLFAGLIVFALRKTAAKLKGNPYSRWKVFLWIEGILAIGLFAAGLFLRAGKMQADIRDSVFFDLAYVSSDEQTIPLFAHGAVYFYLWILRLVFMLLGNKMSVALGLQLVLQMLCVVLFYFALRKMAGRVPAVMMMSFFMLSSYMVEKTVFISPEMLYLLLFSVVLLYVSFGVDCARGCGFWIPAGVMAAALIYLDVAGLLLIPLMLGVIVTRRQETKRKIINGMLGVVAGLVIGAAVCVSVDALSSSKSVFGIIEAWGQLYSFDKPRFTVILSGSGTVWLVTLLLCFMAWGIFSSWCGGKAERFSIWIFCLLIAALMQCLGIFTEEMSGAVYIFFFSTVLAGLSVKESVAVPEAEESEEESNEKKAYFSDFEVEELGEDEQEEPVAGEDQKLSESRVEEEKDETQTEEEQESKESVTEGTDEAQTEGFEQPSEKEQAAREEKETVAEEKKSDETQDQKESQRKREIEYIENPLPLPKKHVKRVMDYALDFEPDSGKDLGGYDIYVSDDDDFDH